MITFTKESITPEMARVFLDNHPRNRRTKQRIIDLYAAEMGAGRWKTETAEPIKIGKDGSLLDGQHRLLAIIKAKVSVFMYVARNVPEDSFDVLDTGAGRTAGDVFRIKNISNGAVLPGIIGIYNVLKVEGQNPTGIQKNKKGTNAMLLEQYEENHEYWQEIARTSMRLYLEFSKILAPSYIGGLYAFFMDKSIDGAERFINQLCSGADIENDVILHLRNKLVSDKISPRKMPMDLKMALIIKSWNVFLEKKSITLLRWDSIRETFPIAKHEG